MAQGLQVTLVAMLSTQIVRLVQQALLAAGGSKDHTRPPLTVLLLEQISIGWTRATVTVWSQMAALLQPSVNSHVSVMAIGHVPLVTKPIGVMVTLLLQQDEAVGGSNVQFESHGTVLLVGQETKKPRLVLL